MKSIDERTENRTEIATAKVLFIVSGATYWVLKDGTRYATGYWAEEFAKPYKDPHGCRPRSGRGDAEWRDAER